MLALSTLAPALADNMMKASPKPSSSPMHGAMQSQSHAMKGHAMHSNQMKGNAMHGGHMMASPTPKPNA